MRRPAKGLTARYVLLCPPHSHHPRTTLNHKASLRGTRGTAGAFPRKADPDKPKGNGGLQHKPLYSCRCQYSAASHLRRKAGHIFCSGRCQASLFLRSPAIKLLRRALSMVQPILQNNPTSSSPCLQLDGQIEMVTKYMTTASKYSMLLVMMTKTTVRMETMVMTMIVIPSSKQQPPLEYKVRGRSGVSPMCRHHHHRHHRCCHHHQYCHHHHHHHTHSKSI